MLMEGKSAYAVVVGAGVVVSASVGALMRCQKVN